MPRHIAMSRNTVCKLVSDTQLPKLLWRDNLSNLYLYLGYNGPCFPAFCSLALWLLSRCTASASTCMYSDLHDCAVAGTIQ